MAPSDSTFITIALTGTTTEPVIRNSSTNVATTTMPTANGSRDVIESRRSTISAGSPPTCTGKPGSRSRTSSTTAWAVRPLVSPSAWISTRVDAWRRDTSLVDDGLDHAGRARRSRSSHTATRGSSGATSASACTGSAVTAGKRASIASATWRVSDDSGSALTPVSSNRACRNGAASRTRPTPTTTTTSTARRMHEVGEAGERAVRRGGRPGRQPVPAPGQQRRKQGHGGDHRRQHDPDAAVGQRADGGIGEHGQCHAAPPRPWRPRTRRCVPAVAIVRCRAAGTS